MAKFNKTVAENPKLEMIHVSLDDGKASAQGWAVSAKLPWLTVMPEDVKATGLAKFKKTRYVPEYALVSADGTLLANDNGGTKVFAMAKEKAK